MSVTRRDFLIASTCMATVGAFRVVYGLETQGKRYTLIHDEGACIGCTACEEACRTVNAVPEGVSRLKIIRTGPVGQFPDGEFQFFRQSCQHCDNPPCVTLCPSGASFRDPDTGIVDVDPDRCVGCQYCVAACPYRVRYIDPVTQAADKCDFCRKTNLAQGKSPACVESCPTKALVFGDLNDPNSEVSQIIATSATYRTKVELGTDPHLYRIAAPSGGSRS